jgi:hypothetical protein
MPNTDRLFAEAAEKLKETVRLGLTFDAAQVKVVGLEHIRQAAGDTWPQFADRIRANSLAFIEGCLSDGDITIPCGDGFLIIYAHKPDGKRDLARECATMQDALNGFYLGEEGLQMLHSQVQAQQVRASDMAKLLSPEPRKRAEESSDLARSMTFVPVWSVEPQAVGLHVVTPIEIVKDELHAGYDQSYRATGRHDHRDFAQLDMMMLDRVSQMIETHGERCGLLCYSVHSSTMARRHTRGAFLARLMDIPEKQRRLLVGLIAEIEPGTPTVTIADWVHQLRAFTARTALELHHSERGIFGFDTVGAWSISIALPAAMQTLANRMNYEATIRRWSMQAHGQGLKFGLSGLVDPYLMNASIKAGVDYFSSPRLWPTLSEPQSIRHCSRAEVQLALAKLMQPVPARRAINAPVAHHAP